MAADVSCYGCRYFLRGSEYNKKACHDGDRSFSGADDEARTRYLNLGKVALYQMSYIRKFLLSLKDVFYYKL